MQGRPAAEVIQHRYAHQGSNPPQPVPYTPGLIASLRWCVHPLAAATRGSVHVREPASPSHSWPRNLTTMRYARFRSSCVRGRPSRWTDERVDWRVWKAPGPCVMLVLTCPAGSISHYVGGPPFHIAQSKAWGSGFGEKALGLITPGPTPEFDTAASTATTCSVPPPHRP